MKKNKLITTSLLAMLLLGASPASNYIGLTAYTANAEQTIIAETGTLTLHKKKAGDLTALEGAEFTAYKVMDFDAKVAAAKNGSEYVIDPAFAAFFTEKGITPDKISGYNTTKLESLITEMQAYIKDKNIAGKYTATSNLSGDVAFGTVDTGYYLIVETKVPAGYASTARPFMVSVPNTEKTALDTWNYDVEVEVKNDKVDVDKTIEENGSSTEKTTTGVGDVLHYQIEANVIKYADETDPTKVRFAIKDEMSAGLTLDKAKIDVFAVAEDGTEKKLNTPSDYSLLFKGDQATITGEAVTESKTFGVYFDYAKIKDVKKVKVKYTATINEKAVIGGTGNQNAGELEYGTDQDEQWHVTPPDKTAAYVTGIDLLKIDGEDDAKKLAGAQFGLYMDKACTTLAQLFEVAADGTLSAINGANPRETDSNGLAKFYGLKAGTYYLKEVKSPEGYQLLADVVEIKIEADLASLGEDFTGSEKLTIKAYANGEELTITDNGEGGYIHLNVKNNKGFTLPITGGMGTYLFTGAGLIVILAGLMTWSKSGKKKKALN